MMHLNKNEGSEEILKTEMDYERPRPQKDGPCGKQTGILVLLGMVAMVISMIILFVICGDLVKKVTRVQNSVSSLNLNLNKSTDPVTNGNTEKRLSDIERLMNNLGSSLNSLTSKQEEDLRRLEERLISSLNELKAQINTKLSSDKPVCNCKSGWTPYNNSCYLFSSDKLNWMQARDYCKKQGASLLKLDGSDEEWAFVTDVEVGHWIGLTDQTTGQWRWTDDTPYTDKKRWHEGQPDDWKEHGKGEDGEDCAQITKLGTLNDAHCTIKYNFICKTEPEIN